MPRRARRIDPFRLNREIAYKGDIGKRREDFCIGFMKKKGEIIKEIQASQIQATDKNGETITCRKGCSYCCFLYMQASVPECEAIVYYLYHNENALATFLKNYRHWRKKLKENGDIFQKCARLWYDKTAPGAGLKECQAFDEETARYQQQNVPCPFLHNGSCLIYGVRPFLCAGTVATTPNDWCSPSNTNKPTMYKTQTPAIFDKSFYYREIEGFVLTFFPITVYDILEGGYKMLAKITGLEDLEEAALRQPEVRAVMESFL